MMYMSHSRKRRGRSQGGFSLIELMVGMAVGLMATLVIAEVMRVSEGQRRNATSGSDAQINGGMAIYTLQRNLKMAGYGLVTEPDAIGCRLTSGFGMATMPPTLAPALITSGGANNPDTVRILSSSKTGFSLPTRLIAPFYDPNGAGDLPTRMPVASSLGINANDLMALVYGRDAACQVFVVSAQPPAGVVPRTDGLKWNTAKFPDRVPVDGNFLVNLGNFGDVTFSVSAAATLQQTTIDHPNQASTTTDLQSNIVTMKALYGKDTNGDGQVDTYDAVTPVTNAGWLQVLSIRVVVLARSEQYEKEEVTTALPEWDLGSTVTVPGSSDCGGNKCITLRPDTNDADWRHYRYKQFETLVPLRNHLWRA